MTVTPTSLTRAAGISAAVTASDLAPVPAGHAAAR